MKYKIAFFFKKKKNNNKGQTPKLEENRYCIKLFPGIIFNCKWFLKAKKLAYGSSIYIGIDSAYHVAKTFKIYGLSNIFSAFPPHTNYLILLDWGPRLLLLPERVWKFQAGIALILLNFFFLACNLISSRSDLIPLMPEAWRSLLICIMDVWRKNETIERRARGWEHSSKSKISISKAGHFCSTLSIKEEPKFKAWPHIQWSSLFNFFFLSWLVKHFMARTKKAMAEC